MTVQPLTPELAERLDLPRQTRGVVTTDLDPTGQAASAGLREGDVASFPRFISPFFRSFPPFRRRPTSPTRPA
jgi:hypothetical protein